MALQSCLLGQAGGQRDVLPRTWVLRQELQKCRGQGPPAFLGFLSAFLTKAFRTSLLRMGILGLRKPVNKGGVGGLWTVAMMLVDSSPSTSVRYVSAEGPLLSCL